jgi:hypothetical protein
MPNILEEFLGSMGPEVTKKLSSSLNIEEDKVQQIIPQIAPLIIGGLKKQKDEQGGQERVDHILNKYGSADVLGNLDDLFGKKLNDSRTDPGLGGLLGDSGHQATNLISEKFGINGSTAAKLIPMLAPVVLGFLTHKRDNQGAGSSGLASLLDKDGDGSILDDVAGMFLGGSGKSNPLGDMLGGILGGK